MVSDPEHLLLLFSGSAAEHTGFLLLMHFGASLLQKHERQLQVAGLPPCLSCAIAERSLQNNHFEHVFDLFSRFSVLLFSITKPQIMCGYMAKYIIVEYFCDGIRKIKLNRITTVLLGYKN